MKPFNLELAKAGKPIVTRDGRSVKFIAHVPGAYKDERVVVLINQTIELMHEDGMFYSSGGPSNIDLFMYEGFIHINGHKYPEPERKPLQYGQVYWILNPTRGVGVSMCSWTDDYLDRHYLERGMIHLSKENALAHYKAMILSGNGTP